MRDNDLLITAGFHEFGAFRLDTNGGELCIDTRTIKLAPKVLQCLILLVESNGRTITKDEFFDKVWADTFVEDNALSYTISQLRKTLAEFDSKTKYIETVSRRGFRFVVPTRKIEPERSNEIVVQRRRIEEVWLEESTDAVVDTPPSTNLLLPGRSKRKTTVWLTMGILLVVAAGALFGYQNWQVKTSASSIRSIAVLPLKSYDTSGDAGELSLRITDALITRLGGLTEISVRPTNSILSFTAGETDLIEAGRQLEVDAVLDGRIQIEGDRLRVTLQLVSVGTGEQIWSGQFDGKPDEILSLQDKISAQLLPNLMPSITLAKNPTANAEAYENYLKGRYLWNTRTAPELKQAVVYFEQAIVLDPNFALAYSGLADAYSQLTNRSEIPRFEGYEKAKQMAQKALAIDPRLSEAYSALGWILYIHEWNWAGAEEAFNRAVELNPNNAEAYHWRGLNLLAQGKMEPYYASMEKARQLAPLTKPIAQNYYNVLLRRDGCQKAFEYFDKFFDFYQYSDEARSEVLGSHHALCGDWAKAIEMLEQVPIEKLGGKSQTTLGVAYARTGRRQDSLAIVERLKNNKSTIRYFLMPCVYAALGDFDAAFADLEKGISVRDDRFARLKIDPFLVPLHSDPRFEQLLEKMNLPV